MSTTEMQIFYSKRFKYLFNYSVLFLYINIALFLIIATSLYFDVNYPLLLIFLEFIILIEICSLQHIKSYTRFYEYEARTGRSFYSV